MVRGSVPIAAAKRGTQELDHIVEDFGVLRVRILLEKGPA